MQHLLNGQNISSPFWYLSLGMKGSSHMPYRTPEIYVDRCRLIYVLPMHMHCHSRVDRRVYMFPYILCDMYHCWQQFVTLQLTCIPQRIVARQHMAGLQSLVEVSCNCKSR